MKKLFLFSCLLCCCLFSFSQTAWFSEATGTHYTPGFGMLTGQAGVRLSGGDFLVCGLGPENRIKINWYNPAGEWVQSMKQPEGSPHVISISGAELLPDESAIIISGTAQPDSLMGWYYTGFFLAKADLATHEVDFIFRHPTAPPHIHAPQVEITADRIYALYSNYFYPVVAAYDHNLNALWSKGFCPAGSDTATFSYPASALALLHDTLVVSVNNSTTTSFELIKLNSGGSFAGFDTYTAASSKYIRGMERAADGNLFLCGSENNKPMVLKVSAAGTPLWSGITNDPGYTMNLFVSMYEKPDGSLLALGAPYLSTTNEINAFASLNASATPLSAATFTGGGLTYNFFNPRFGTGDVMLSGTSSIIGVFTNNVLWYSDHDFSIACHKTPLAVYAETGAPGTVTHLPSGALSIWDTPPLLHTSIFTMAADTSEIPVYCYLETSARDARDAPFALFPNPVRSGASVQLTFPHPGDYTVCVRDAAGRETWQQKVSGSTAEVNPGNLAAGLYVLTLCEKGAVVHSSRLMVQ